MARNQVIIAPRPAMWKLLSTFLTFFEPRHIIGRSQKLSQCSELKPTTRIWPAPDMDQKWRQVNLVLDIIPSETQYVLMELEALFLCAMKINSFSNYNEEHIKMPIFKLGLLRVTTKNTASLEFAYCMKLKCNLRFMMCYLQIVKVKTNFI
ncbi:Hypothetical_protein [Hexamita inflata]|uniref:Hypothetical_protein n=1 Tax=Hexamita inflata TaxID=28002 RepID=A0AA86VT62_9EUKA|nr:Hypothetical protein HINF_LOCUS10607 [Hexamita inflata]CAI9977053.1 Hypothetical protein HINF_LOCUS64698 [Hexamita inflata]CAI9977055.1 Hypothetical protein HINF_LOCUS64700 [Hexamita inflata]